MFRDSLFGYLGPLCMHIHLSEQNGIIWLGARANMKQAIDKFRDIDRHKFRFCRYLQILLGSQSLSQIVTVYTKYNNYWIH